MRKFTKSRLTRHLAIAFVCLLPGAAAAEFVAIPLPEPSGALGSEVTAVRKSSRLASRRASRRASMRATGSVIDAGGTEKAAFWRAASSAGLFSAIGVEDPLPAGSSRIEATQCIALDCIAVGSSGDPGSRLPIVWREQNLPGCTWCVDGTLVSPALMLEGWLHGGTVRSLAGGAVHVAVGSAVLQDGTPNGTEKAALWSHDGASWSAATAPDPAAPGPWTTRLHQALYVQSPVGANATFYVGTGDDGAGTDALVWTQPDGGAVGVPFALPIPSGAAEAAGHALVASAGALHVVGTGHASSPSGSPHVIVWSCSAATCETAGDWSVDRELTPPAGHADCEPGDAGDVRRAPGDRDLEVVGRCADGGGGPVAVLWAFDPTVPSASTQGERLVDAIGGPQPGLLLEAASGVSGRGTVATGRIETGTSFASVGSHAYFLVVTTSVPALSLGAAGLLTFGLLLAAALRPPRG